MRTECTICCENYVFTSWLNTTYGHLGKCEQSGQSMITRKDSRHWAWQFAWFRAELAGGATKTHRRANTEQWQSSQRVGVPRSNVQGAALRVALAVRHVEPCIDTTQAEIERVTREEVSRTVHAHLRVLPHDVIVARPDRSSWLFERPSVGRLRCVDVTLNAQHWLRQLHHNFPKSHS